MRTIALLVPRDPDAVIPSLFEHRLPKCLGTIGVGALTDGQICDLLIETHRLVERRDSRLRNRRPFDHLRRAHPLHHFAQMFRGGAATSAHESETVVAHKHLVGVCQFRRSERVVGPIGGELW